MRLFVALELPEELRASLASSSFSVEGMKARWTPHENMHITLKFLGEVSDAMLQKAKEAISHVASSADAFDVTIEGLGSFGRPPRIVWAGITDGKLDMVSLMGALEKGLGFIIKEDREPSPHMTLARVDSCGDVKQLMKAIEPMRTKRFGSFRAQSITLKRSVLKPQGPVYSTIEDFPLKVKA